MSLSVLRTLIVPSVLALLSSLGESTVHGVDQVIQTIINVLWCLSRDGDETNVLWDGSERRIMWSSLWKYLNLCKKLLMACLEHVSLFANDASCNIMWDVEFEETLVALLRVWIWFSGFHVDQALGNGDVLGISDNSDCVCVVITSKLACRSFTDQLQSASTLTNNAS